MKIETVIQRIEQEQSMLSREALAKPAGRESFDYGRVVGMYAGLEQAKQAILAMFDEKERKNFDL